MGISLENVGRRYANQWGIREFSASIENGSIVAVLGANGAGKSTLFRLIAGQYPATAGRIYVDGVRVKPNCTIARRNLHLIDVPNGEDVQCQKLIYQMILDYGIERQELPGEIANWFGRFNLVGRYGSTMRQLSRGERYKIALIGLFVTAPKVWLLDEPFSSGLDANGLQILLAESRRHAAWGGIVIFSSQWPKHALELASEIIVLDKGQLAWKGEPGQMPDLYDNGNIAVELRAVLDQLAI